MSGKLPVLSSIMGVPLQRQLDVLTSRLPKGKTAFVGNEEQRRQYIKLMEVWFSQQPSGAGLDMRDWQLDGIDLHFARMMQINAAGTDFSGGFFDQTALMGAVLDGCNFSRANCQNADFTAATAHRANFRRTRLYNARLCKMAAQGADFYGADLRDANLSGSDFQKANFKKIRISRLTNFRGCNFTGTILEGRGLERQGLYCAVRPFYMRSWLRTLGEYLRKGFS